MIEAYIDESGTHDESPVVSVACYAGTPEQWASFTNEWVPILKKSGLPYFHAKDSACDPLRPHLVKLIQKNELRGIVCAVDKSIYKNHANDQFRTHLGNMYSACAFMCVIESCKWAKENRKGQVGFFIEAGQPNDTYVEKVLKNYMAEDNQLDISSVTLVRKDFHPLATADFLSHICSVNDYAWQDNIDAIGNHFRSDMTKKQLEDSSKLIKDLIVKQRNIRHALKKQEK
jgi:hypothetical protein